MTIKQRIFTLLALISALAFNAAALPMTKAGQVAVDASSMTTLTGENAQAAFEQIDARIGSASTDTVGVVRFSTEAEVTAGTGTSSVITPADLALKVNQFGMRYSGEVVYEGGVVTSFTDLDLSSVVGHNRCFVHLMYKQVTGVAVWLRMRTNGRLSDVGGSSDGPGGSSASDVSVGGIATLSLITDENGVVEWMTSVGSGTASIWVNCYQVLLP
jgi:hypothetical protein